MGEQEQFAEKDLVLINGVLTLLAFLNIYDQGYRAKAVAHRAGKQLVLQPAFAESDKHFNRIQTLLSASVATDRGGNVRAVGISKRLRYVKRGYQPCSDPKQMNDAWLTQSFQSNFMHAPVL